MQVLGLITARGGSKGIPRKNLSLLCGRPLLDYTCAAARASQRLTRVLLSTDDSEIADAGRRGGVEVPFLRPRELAADQSTSLDVALHALQWLREQESWAPDALMILQPTSPLRTPPQIDEAVDLLARTGADTVVSVVPVPHRFSPFSLMKLEDGWLKDFHEGPLPFDRFQRQAMPRLYARNGPVVLVTRVATILEKRSFYGERITPFPMNEIDSVDIDSPFDLLIAEAALRTRTPAA